MRKYLIRWWYTPAWRGDRLMQAIREWSDKEYASRDEAIDEALRNYSDLFGQLDVAVERLRFRVPYTGSGDLFDPYRCFQLPTGNGTPLWTRE